MFSSSLCLSCKNKREIRNKRGSVFYLCDKSKEDPRYRKYPPQPVFHCPAYELLEKED